MFGIFQWGLLIRKQIFLFNNLDFKFSNQLESYMRAIFCFINLFLLCACLDVKDVSVVTLDAGRTCSVNIPEPNDPCLPDCGNELGVGQPCTKGGYECSDFNIVTEAGMCTVDFSNTTELAFCTRPCSNDNDCGTGAICRVDPEDPNASKGCVPKTCTDED